MGGTEMKINSELIFIPSPGIGHLTSSLEFAKLLINRDNNLSIKILCIKFPFSPFSDSYIRSVLASQPNIKLIDLPQIEPPPQHELLKSPEHYIWTFMESLKPHIKITIMQNILPSYPNSESHQVVGLVLDLFCSSMVDVGNELGIPSYLFFTSTVTFLGFMLSLLKRQIEDVFNNSDHELLIPSFNIPVPPSVLPDAAFNKDGGYAAYYKFAQRFMDTKGIIVNSFSELEQHAIDALQNGQTPPIYAVGPLIDLKGQPNPNLDQALHDKILKWLDEQPDSSVVFLCFGSMGGFGPSQTREMALALQGSGVRFLWAMRSPPTTDNSDRTLPEGFLEWMEDKGMICGWAPQVEVLAHKAIGGFVSHCGWNSILESLWFGVPILTWPIYAEQQMNAFTMVREFGLAVELRVDYRTGGDLVVAKEIEEGLKQLMDRDNVVHKNVKEMKEKARKAVLTGLDRPGIRVRPVSGLVAADYFAPGYFVWAVLIANLARIGYEEKNMYMAAYDWRMSFQNTEVRDRTLSRMKSNIELMVATNGGKNVVVIPHSMGVLYFLHFMKWVEAPAPMGGGGGSDWCAKHIKAVMNIGGPFLGVPKSVAGLFSIEARDIAVARTFAPGFLDKDVFGLQTLQHLMRMTRTWDSTMSMIPKGGDTIWGGLDWSPEVSNNCSVKKPKNNDTYSAFKNDKENLGFVKKINYGRLISFGKDVAELHSSKLERLDFRGAFKGRNLANTSNCDVWTEYHEMGIEGIKAVTDYKTYTADSVLDLLHFVAPKMMKRGDAHFSYGIADNLDDQKYKHYKYWSNPLETTYGDYGVGIPTERAYVYKFAPQSECHIPFQIDTSADGGHEHSCLKDGVYCSDGDETVPVLSAGFMGAKAWRGRTRFNPSGIRTFIREYDHAPPANLLEGRGTQSGAHVDILGNFALLEDIIRVAAGASGEDLGGR